MGHEPTSANKLCMWRNSPHQTGRGRGMVEFQRDLDCLALFERMVSLGIDLSATRMLFALGEQLPHVGMSISTASKGADRWQR
jgi:hypothetical protein